MHNLLVIGGARSGKSRYAQAQAEATGLSPVFIATAQPFDEEMRERITRHQADRGSEWKTVEAPLELAETIAAHSSPENVLLVDCLTLWVTNLLLSGLDISQSLEKVVNVINRCQGGIIFVSNEVGWGIVPENALARRFRDEAGLVNQRVAAIADSVHLMCAGIPMTVK